METAAVTSDRVREAIKQLREEMGLTQIEFAKQIGRSYGIVQRYEQLRPPRGGSLTPFLELAAKAGRLDLEAIFRSWYLETAAVNSPNPGLDNPLAKVGLKIMTDMVLATLFEIEPPPTAKEISSLTLWLRLTRALSVAQVAELHREIHGALETKKRESLAAVPASSVRRIRRLISEAGHVPEKQKRS